MSTQLRLVEAPVKRSKPKASTSTASRAKARPERARRAVHWGAWQLDDQTRRVGRAGVAAARRALEEARAAQELRQAS